MGCPSPARRRTNLITATSDAAQIEMAHLLIGRDYILQVSRDLQSWDDVRAFTASVGTNQVTQPRSATIASVFYRLRWER